MNDEDIKKLASILLAKLKRANYFEAQTLLDQVLELDDGSTIVALLEDSVIATRNGSLIKKLGYAKGVDVNKLGAALIELNDAYNICGFCRGKDIDLEPYEDVVIQSQSAYLISKFAKTCKNCNLDRLQAALCEIGTGSDLFYFARDEKRADKQLLAENYLQKRYIKYISGGFNMFKAFSELEGVDSKMFDEYENAIRQKMLTNPDYDGKKFYLFVYYLSFPDTPTPQKCSSVILCDYASMEECAYSPDVEIIKELSLNELDKLVENPRVISNL